MRTRGSNTFGAVAVNGFSVGNSYPASNPFTPPIPQPAANVENLAACVAALKACVESLIGQRGDASNRAVTFNDLVSFGLLSPDAVTSPSGSFAASITEVIAGTGLIGGGTNGPVTLALGPPAPYVPISGGRMTGELIIGNATAYGQIRFTNATTGSGGYGSFIRNDGTRTYLLITNNNDALGQWSNLRPFSVDNANGLVHMENGLLLESSSLTNILMVRNATGTNLRIFDDSNSHIESSSTLWINGYGGPVTIGGPLTAQAITTTANIIGGPFESTGVNAIYGFHDRTNNAYWGLYAHDGGARIYNQSYGDVVTINAGGSITLNGELHAGGSLFTGYHLYLGGQYICFNGNTSASVGPFVYVDNNNWIFRLGTGNNAYYFDNSAGTQLAVITGDLVLSGSHVRFQNAGLLSVAGGGPVIYGDGNWIVVKPGTGNLGFMCYDSNANSYFQALTNNSIVLGNYKIIQADWQNTGYTKIYQNNGSDVAIYAGTGTTYHRNNHHRFDASDASGGANWVVFDGNVHVNSGHIYMDGSGSVLLNNNCAYYMKDNAGVDHPLIYMANNNYIYLANSGQPVWCNGQVIFNNHTYPAANNALQSGVGSQGWSAVWSYAYNTPSDYREKKDITDLPDNCLDLVRSIVPQRFRWNHGVDQEKTHWGFIAQQVGEVMRDRDLDFGGHIISEGEDEKQALNVNELVAVLWRAVQELEAKVSDRLMMGV